MEFAGFFEVAVGKRPYHYQRLLAEADWPDALIAPTGLGKTAAVVLSWLWRLRAFPAETPRRLVFCLPMRTLVDQTAEKVGDWLERLVAAGSGDGLPGPDDIHVLMGGADEPRPGRPCWYEVPERPAILIGTQDMLISRADARLCHEPLPLAGRFRAPPQ